MARAVFIGAAHRSPADTIISRNLSDFPQSTLERYNLRVITPDQLLLSLIETNPDQVMSVVTAMQLVMKTPTLSLPAVLGNLARAGVPNSSAVLRHRLGIRRPVANDQL